jgi:EF-hand domain-containing family member B
MSALVATGRFDGVPNIRAAGKVIALGPGESAKYCLDGDGSKSDQPGTPEHIKRYRKSFQNQPGVKQIHPGMVNDAIPIPDGQRFGKKTFGSDHVDEVIRA